MKNYVLKVRLRDTDIWRTLAIPADCGFFDLHEAIQTAFGWADFYYHEFTAGGTTIADDANEEPDLLPEKFRYEYEANLEFFLKNVKSMTYVYDLEQPWVHEVEIEGVLEEGFDIPVLLDGGGRMVEEIVLDDCETSVDTGAPLNKETINAMLAEMFAP